MTQATERLHEFFKVDFTSGKLFYRHRVGAPPAWNAKWPGKEAGNSVSKTGHLICHIDGGFVRKSHIVFAMKHGRFPKGIRYRDGNPTNTALANLEEVIPFREPQPRK